MTPDRAASGAPVLSLAELESYDPNAPHGQGERRFACPLCGEGKAKNTGHRCLCLNSTSGLWKCNRCKASGKLSDFWQEQPASTRRQRTQERLYRVCDLPPAVPQAAPSREKSHALREALQGQVALSGTAGAKYLQGRSLSLDVCMAAQMRFHPRWLGRPAVMLAIRDQCGALVAAQGRYLDGRDDPKTRTMGEKKLGVFCAPWVSEGGRIFSPFDAEAPAVIITEAPLDALSLAAAGFPALALCGTSGPAWLPKACALRRVLLAFDADAAGDHAAAEMAPTLGSFGVRAIRLRPEGGKDWNEMLQALGPLALAEILAPIVVPT